MTIHGPDAPIDGLPELVHAFVRERTAGAALGRAATKAEMDAVLAGAITAQGLGVDRAWRLFVDGVVANTVGLDSERFLAFVPVSPTPASVWMDAAVGAASFSAESWIEASGAVAAENQALEFLASVAGLPAGAGGCFMTGGSIGNLSALTVARDNRPERRLAAVADTAHASVHNSLHMLGVEVLVVPTGADGRFTGAALRDALRGGACPGIVIAAAGSTNAGLLDDLAGLADVSRELDAWFHVDAAYGGAALLLPEMRDRFAGIERADSMIVDPHKWLFATEGSCALLYRDPELARRVHAQQGPYLDILHGGDEVWNPSDYGYQLTRRATGLPFWFALVLHGVDAHAVAVRRGIELARYAADRLRRVPGVELVVEPELGAVVFRHEGWGRSEWKAWATRLLEDGIAFIAPSTWKGEPIGRLLFQHPRTTEAIVDEIVATL
jgi:glutamate/tyrosine decarboxylase-like PLP-dependent enzyme